MLTSNTVESAVLVIADIDLLEFQAILSRYGMQVERVAAGAAIPGSFWGEPEAGLIDCRLYVRADTPVHSALHEACHFICMDKQRRQGLHTDAGGDYAEENAVCYLQVLLADYLGRVGRLRLLRDMDAWGYSFRLGSAQAWFEQDADDAACWLRERRLIDAGNRPTWNLRQMDVIC